MNYLQLVKAIGSASQHLLGRAAAAVNQSLVIRNWLVGGYIIEFEQDGRDRAEYGAGLLGRLSMDLTATGVKGVSPDMLERMRTLFVCYPQIREQIPAALMRKSWRTGENKMLPISASPMRKSAEPKIKPLSAEAVLRFSWTQLIELIRIDDPLKRAFYENECLQSNWSVRQLQRQIGSLLYERTGLSTDKAAIVVRARRERKQTIDDLIRDPYVLEFTGLSPLPQYTESELEKALLDHLQKFLLELGVGFCFEARQFRVTLGNKHDYVDLVFYHRRLRCHVLLDLKVRPFNHGDAGQMNFYLNYFKDRLAEPGDHPPIGIILCSDNHRTEVEYATAGISNKLFVSRYLTALPSSKELTRFLEQDRARVESLIEQARGRQLSRGKPPRMKQKKAKPCR